MLHLQMDQDQKDRGQWCTAFTAADFPKCKAIALDMLELGSDRQFALKSLAQALHYMGNHREAKGIAEDVRRDARDFLEASAVHPFVSMSIVLARIAYFEGQSALAVELAEEALNHARHHNSVSVCQALAMGCIPVSAWRSDGDSAHKHADLLVEVAEAAQLGYWREWGLSMLHAVGLHFEIKVAASAFDLDALDALQSDHLAMLDGRTMSQLALDRVRLGQVGWTAPEILRLRATTAAWYSPQEARALLTAARALAQRQGALAWVERIDDTRLALADRLSLARPAG